MRSQTMTDLNCCKSHKSALFVVLEESHGVIKRLLSKATTNYYFYYRLKQKLATFIKITFSHIC